eukprot:365372-Chlamydomonas_euryale.AAC.14
MSTNRVAWLVIRLGTSIPECVDGNSVASHQRPAVSPDLARSTCSYNTRPRRKLQARLPETLLVG